jgi:peptidoglycan/xylan/chitin deacetylase (PgdA/CDA1 family)
MARSKFAPSALVLVYHRVADLETDPQQLAVSPRHFHEHMEVIKSCAHTISIAGLVNQLRERQFRGRHIAITFDDGYADNLIMAKPILEKNEVPATVFVVTGMMQSNTEFWWDALERIFLTSDYLPEILRLEIDHEVREWKLAMRSSGSPLSEKDIASWSVLSKGNPSNRHRVYREVCGVLRKSRWEEKQRLLQELSTWSGVKTQSRETYRTLTPEEVQELNRGGLIEIGAHTVTHTALSILDFKGQHQEMLESRRRLQELAGSEVKSFAYPYGTRSDYSEISMQIAKEVGFTSACANVEGVVFAGVDYYQIPRILVRNMSGDALARQLSVYW